jgi:hypothetical protein
MQTNPEIFKNNMIELSKRYPDLALMLSLVEIGQRFELVQLENCIPNVKVDREFYYYGNMKDYCEEQFAGFSLSNVKIPVFMGAGLFYEIMYWMAEKSKEFQSQSIIIFEKDPELFMCAMNVNDLTQIISNPNVHLFIGIPLNQLYTILRTFYQAHIQEMLMCGATQPIFIYPAMKFGKDYYIKAMQIFYESIFHTIQNFGNCPEDSLVGLENMLDNVSEIVNNPGINLLYNKFKGKPAIVVATGPSLNKNMHLLKGLEDNALIISCDASFKLLMNNGIKPHMVTSLEREHEVQQFFDNFEPDAVEDVYMTACPVLFNHVYKSYTGKQIIVYRNFDHFKWLQIDRGILDIKLTSSHMAFKIAEALGCEPIILIGQDLAYGENGETHATEVPFSSEGEGMLNVKGNYQDEIKTNTGWYGFLKAYEVDISQHHGKVINCTEGGAYIQGTHILKFDETIEKYITESFNPLEIIKENLAQFTTAKNDTERLRDIVEQTESEVRNIIDNCVKGAELCNKYKDELESNPTQERFADIRLEVIAPRIEIQGKYNNTFQKFLMHVVQSIHLAHEMETIMHCDNSIDILLKFINWYSFVGDISELCLQSLIKAKKKLF